jgi:hypothetical protein
MKPSSVVGDQVVAGVLTEGDRQFAPTGDQIGGDLQLREVASLLSGAIVRPEEEEAHAWCAQLRRF